MTPVVDYGAIVERDFEPAPKGRYHARFSSEPNQLREGPKGPYYSLRFIGDGGEEDAFNNKSVWENASIAPTGLWKFKDVMLKLGAAQSDFVPGSGVDTDETVASVNGAGCWLDLDVEWYTPSNPEMDDDGNPIKKQRNVIKGMSRDS